MNLDEDEPPSLVHVEGDESVPPNNDKPAVKVPITIVTGSIYHVQYTILILIMHQDILEPERPH